MIRLRGAVVRPEPAVCDSWDRAVDRFKRATHRYHDKSESVSDRALRLELIRNGETLDSCLSDLQTALRAGPTPGREAVVVRATHRAATLCSHTTEAAMMAADRARHREFEDVIRCVDTVRTLTKAIRELSDVCVISR